MLKLFAHLGNQWPFAICTERLLAALFASYVRGKDKELAHPSQISHPLSSRKSTFSRFSDPHLLNGPLRARHNEKLEANLPPMKGRVSPVSSCSEGIYFLNWCRKKILPHERKYLWVCKAKEEGDQDPLGRSWEAGHNLGMIKWWEDTCVDKVEGKS